MREPKFDVFLCHNSVDKDQVKLIGRLLQQQGLSVWLDEWNLVPGRPWVQSLEEILPRIKTVAVFVGPGGIGPWQGMETYALLQQFVNRKVPVIPVILAGATEPVDVPLLLSVFTWVDFRNEASNPLEKLIWGIRGDKGGPV